MFLYVLQPIFRHRILVIIVVGNHGRVFEEINFVDSDAMNVKSGSLSQFLYQFGLFLGFYHFYSFVPEHVLAFLAEYKFCIEQQNDNKDDAHYYGEFVVFELYAAD